MDTTVKYTNGIGEGNAMKRVSMPTNNTASSANGDIAPILLGSADWNDEWKRLQLLRRHRDQANFWTKRSKDFDRPDEPSPYTRDFVKLAALGDCDTAFDMGCGTGSIAVSLARAGHAVLAADFSSGMIAELRKRAEAAGTDNIRAIEMAWEDEWADFGIEPNSFDVAIASRSLSVADLGSALDKFSAVARKKCCVTVSCGYSPRMDARILEVCGLENLHGRDHQYVWNMLVNKGYEPSCSYIRSIRKDTFESAEDARRDFGRMVDDLAHVYPEEAIVRAHAKLSDWIDANLVENEDAGRIDEKGYPEKHFRLKNPRTITWAFISWEV